MTRDSAFGRLGADVDRAVERLDRAGGAVRVVDVQLEQGCPCCDGVARLGQAHHAGGRR